MSAYEPGTVAVATVRGVPNVRVFRTAQVQDAHVYLWQSARVVDNAVGFQDDDVTDVRPLVELDPEEFGGWSYIVEALRNCPTAQSVSRALAAAIEAQSKPPRIPEPGLWGVVEASVAFEGSTYATELVRYAGPSTAKNWLGHDRQWYRWDDLVDPVLVRDGIEGQS